MMIELVVVSHKGLHGREPIRISVEVKRPPQNWELVHLGGPTRMGMYCEYPKKPPRVLVTEETFEFLASRKQLAA